MSATADLTSSSGTTRDTVTIGAWTAVSRATGVLRVVAIGAVLGPTFFGNTYQLTNTLPNLVYYGFLAGSLFCSLLVPAMVRHIDAGEPGESTRIIGGFLGITFATLALLCPLVVLLLPQLLKITAGDRPGGLDPAELDVARALTLMMIPQVFFYAVIGAATAVMYAHRRFALPAAAPAVENIGVLVVLGIVALRYGTGHDIGAVPTGELVVLGLGSTAAVGVHAALQWWGARRAGLVLLPRLGWRDPEVVGVIRRALRALAQSGLLALQLLAMLLVANRAAGGTVAVQVALNFYYLPLALVATPVAMALLPRLARLHRDDDRDRVAASDDDTSYTDTVRQGLGLTLFLVVPAAVGYLVLADVLADAATAGEMGTELGRAMVAGCLVALAVGLAGEAVFFVLTQASYARKDTVTPLVSMGLQTVVCLGLLVVAALGDPDDLLPRVGAAYALASLVGAAHLFLRTGRRWGPSRVRLRGSWMRVVVGAAVMAGPVHLSVVAVGHQLAGRAAWVVSLSLGTLVGLVVYAAAQALMRAPELSWLKDAMRFRVAP